MRMKTKPLPRFIGLAIVSLSAFAFTASLSPARAQTDDTVIVQEEQPPAVNLPAGVQLPNRIIITSTNTSAGGTNSTLRTPEERRLQEILKLTFDRRPQTILQALAKASGDNTAPTNDVERFQASVVTGDWPAVKSFLAKL